MSFRDLLLEVRRDVKDLFQKMDHIETRLDTEVITKTEFSMWKETQKNIRRYAITTIISLFILVAAIAGVALNIGN
jgi:hypothetical protein